MAAHRSSVGTGYTKSGKKTGNAALRPKVQHASRYTDDNGHLRPALFDAEATNEAKAMKGIKTAQLRRFYGQVTADRRRFELRADGSEPPEDTEAQVAMAMLKASTAYAAAREKANEPLAEFAAHHAGLVETVTDFLHFARHFEAVVAWHKVFGDKKG